MTQKLSDELVYFVVEGLLEKRIQATDLARELLERYAHELAWVLAGDDPKKHLRKTRPKVYDILREGIDRGFARLTPPLNQTLAQELADKFAIDSERRKIRVVNVRSRDSNKQRVLDQVCKTGAEVVLDLIIRLGKKRQGARVGVGLGAGHTTMNVARRLGRLLSLHAECPPLTLHALTSGFSSDPRPAPVTFFRFFDEALVDIEYVPLFSAPTVDCKDYEQVKKQPVVKKAFERASDIDVVITSLAAVGDAHGLLNLVLQDNPQTRQELIDRGWVGDVQFLPYSETASIQLSSGIRAVTLFELSDLCRLAGKDDKYVVLLAGPCNICGQSKTKALRPLLHQKELRMWSHLVTDLDSAKAVLGDLP